MKTLSKLTHNEIAEVSGGDVCKCISDCYRSVSGLIAYSYHTKIDTLVINAIQTGGYESNPSLNESYRVRVNIVGNMTTEICRDHCCNQIGALGWKCGDSATRMCYE